MQGPELAVPWMKNWVCLLFLGHPTLDWVFESFVVCSNRRIFQLWKCLLVWQNYLPPDPQFWSLTQFYSVDFSKSRIRVKKCIFDKRTIKVGVSCSWRHPGTSAPSAAHLTVSLFLCGSGINAWGELRALEGHQVSSKSPSRVRDGGETRELLGGTEENSVSSTRIHWFALQANQWFLT